MRGLAWNDIGRNMGNDDHLKSDGLCFEKIVHPFNKHISVKLLTGAKLYEDTKFKS